MKKKDDMNFHELLEIKREMKKKDNIILDLLGRLDANQGQKMARPVREQIRDNKQPKQIQANRAMPL